MIVTDEAEKQELKRGFMAHLASHGHTLKSFCTMYALDYYHLYNLLNRAKKIDSKKLEEIKNILK